MLDIKFSESSINSLCNKLTQVALNMAFNTENAMKQVMKNAQEEALSRKIGTKDTSKIPYEIRKDNSFIIGMLRTNMPLKGEYKSYAPMIEFGTGKLGELAKLGKTKTFIESGFSYWYLPVEKAPKDFGTKRLITIGDKQFYIMYSQSPRPFMRPTAVYLRDNAKITISEELRRKVKELCTN